MILLWELNGIEQRASVRCREEKMMEQGKIRNAEDERCGTVIRVRAAFSCTDYSLIIATN